MWIEVPNLEWRQERIRFEQNEFIAKFQAWIVDARIGPERKLTVVKQASGISISNRHRQNHCTAQTELTNCPWSQFNGPQSVIDESMRQSHKRFIGSQSNFNAFANPCILLSLRFKDYAIWQISDRYWCIRNISARHGFGRVP